MSRGIEQRAGEGPLRCYGNDAAPAGHVGCTQGRADGSVRARSARLCKEPQEGRGFRAPAATNLDGENHTAALRARQLGVGVATLAPCCGSGVGALADPDSSLERKGAGSQGTGVGTCCSMVAERVKRSAACTDSRGEWQRQAQAAKQEHPKLCGAVTRRVPGWASTSSGAGRGGSEASQAGTWQPCAVRWAAACAAAAVSSCRA